MADIKRIAPFQDFPGLDPSSREKVCLVSHTGDQAMERVLKEISPNLCPRDRVELLINAGLLCAAHEAYAAMHTRASPMDRATFLAAAAAVWDYLEWLSAGKAPASQGRAH